MAALSNWISNYKPLLILIYASTCAAFGVIGIESYLGVRIEPKVIMSFVTFVFGVYLLNRTTDLEEDLLNDTNRLIFYTRRRFYFFLAVIVLGTSSSILLLTQKFSW